MSYNEIVEAIFEAMNLRDWELVAELEGYLGYLEAEALDAKGYDD